MTSPGIELATFRLVVQCLNQLRHQQRAPIQLWYGTFYVHQYTMHEYTTIFLKMKLLFETCRRHQKTKNSNLNLENVHLFGLCCI